MLPMRSLPRSTPRPAALLADGRAPAPRPPLRRVSAGGRREGAASTPEPARGFRSPAPALALAPALLLGAMLLAQPAGIQAQTRLTTPQEEFGHEIGADYQLPNYQKLMAYWQKLAVQSDRMVLDTIGLTAEGRPQLMAIVTSPENHRNLERYKEISRRLALADRLTDEEARALAREGKAVVWIDGGLHSTEVLGAQQLMELVWQLVSMDDPETLRFLDDVIVLAVHANPDGHDLVADWYMREPEPTRRSTSGIPRLYQKYIGHDNNRDFYLVSQPETENMSRVMYREWFPQIIYNHHQTGPRGTVLFAPPFRDPFNHYYDPLVVLGIDLVGAAMHSRFVAEGKPGATMRSGANYSTWWNGGLRTTAYFHNMIGLLTETIGNPTPIEIPFLPDRQLPKGDLPFPVPPQTWHFRQSVDYSITANRAVLDVASRYRETLLYNIYVMGRNSIERGSRDHWTIYPSRIEAVRKAMADTRAAGAAAQAGTGAEDGASSSQDYLALLYDPALRDPRGYILPADQPDFPTATKFVNALIKSGVTVHRATAAFTVNGKRYPAGSYVVKTAQAFRPHILDMFEPQDHPNDFRYPGGPPIPPYDVAGWTLAYQMGIRFDRILDGFDGPFEKLDDVVAPPPGRVAAAGRNGGWLLSHRVNDAFVAVNRLLAAGEDVYWLTEPVRAGNTQHAAGTFFIPSSDRALPILRELAREKGLSFEAVGSRPRAEALALRPVRIGLWDRYGGSMPSGWVRWLFEQFEFPFELVFAPELDRGNLREKYDVLVFVGGAMPAVSRTAASGDAPAGGFQPQAPRNVPEEYRERIGSITAAQTIPRLREFLEDGGTILTIGSSTNLAYHLGLPVADKLVELRDDGTERRLSREEFYVPGSVLRVHVDATAPIAHGMDDAVDVMFQNSPTFRLTEDAERRGVRRIAWFDTAEPLRSGWAWGQHHLEGGAAVVEAEVGKGKLFLFGPEITFRAQPHGTFKFLFNGIYLGVAEPARLRKGPRP